MIFPDTLKVSDLDAAHPDYTRNIRTWRRIRPLYSGGTELETNASQFLIRKAYEPEDVYSLRLRLFTYTNVLGPIISWYASALFKREPQISFTGAKDARVDQFLKDAERDGKTSFVSFAQALFKEALLIGCAWTLTDRPTQVAPSRAIEKELGLDVPLLRRFPAEQVLNWSYGEDGRLDWVKAKAIIQQQNPFGKPDITEHWYIWTRDEFAEYIRVVSEDAQQKEFATLAEGGPRPHPLSKEKMVPLRQWCVEPGMWIGDRVRLTVEDLLNQDNTLRYQVYMGNTAMPVVAGVTRESFSGSISEHGMLILPQGATYGWTEPAGNTIATAVARCASLREEAYRQAHLVQQGRDSAATPAAQSGVSKEIDMMPSRDMLEGCGDMLRPELVAILQMALTSMGSKAVPSVDGFVFETSQAPAKMETLALTKESQLQSDTLILELEKDVARELLLNKDEKLRAAVLGELEAAPTQSQRKESALKDAMLQMGGDVDEPEDGGEDEGGPKQKEPKAVPEKKKSKNPVKA